MLILEIFFFVLFCVHFKDVKKKIMFKNSMLMC